MASAYDRTSQHVIYASRAGVPAIASVSSPQSGPDGTAALQSILDLNAPGGPLAGQSLEVVIDIPILCHDIKIYSYTTVRGQGAFAGSSPPSGLWQEASPSSGGTYYTCILRNANWASNYGHSTPNTANITDTSITVRDLYLNGQRGNGASGNVSGYGQFYQSINVNNQIMSPAQFYGVSQLLISNVSVYDPPCYHVHVANIDHGTFRDLRFCDPVMLAGYIDERITDGLHLNGPCNDILIDGLKGTTGDDFLALNAADGNLNQTQGAASGPWMFGSLSNVYYGNIMRVIARNIQPLVSHSCIRSITGNDPRVGGAGVYVDDWLVDGVTGTCYNTPIYWATYSYGQSDPGTHKRVTIRNVHIDVLSGGGYPAGITLGGNNTDILLENISMLDLPSNVSSQLNFGSDAICGRVELRGLRIREDASEVSTPSPPILISQGTVDELVVSGAWSRNSLTNVPFISVTGGTVNRLILDGVSCNYAWPIVSWTGGTLGGITARGLLHRNVGTNPAISLGSVTLPRLRAADSDVYQLISGGTVTSTKTDSTQDN